MLLSRIPDFSSLLLLRLPDRQVLSRPRPRDIRVAYEMFYRQERATLQKLDATLRKLQLHTLRTNILTPLLTSSSSSHPTIPRRSSKRTTNLEATAHHAKRRRH